MRKFIQIAKSEQGHLRPCHFMTNHLRQISSIISPENVRFLASPSDCKGKPVMVDPFGGNEFPDALVNAEVPNPDAIRLQKETCVPQIPVDYVVAVHEG